jgi:hypothetical protein
VLHLISVEIFYNTQLGSIFLKELYKQYKISAILYYFMRWMRLVLAVLSRLATVLQASALGIAVLGRPQAKGN